jgi:hypothetical protein
MNRLASTLVIGIIMAFLGWTLRANWLQIRNYDWRLDPLLLGLSLAVLLGANLANVEIWRLAITRLGHGVSHRRAMRLYFVAGLAKYIPGSVWQYFGWYHLSQREGIEGVSAGVSIVVVQLLSAWAGALVAAAAFAASGSDQIVRQMLVVLIMIALGLVALQPRLMARVLNWGLRLLRRPTVSLDLSFRDLAILCGLYLLSYIPWGLALFLFANSLTPVSWHRFAAFLGVFPAAYVLGLLAPFAPAGVGVREGALIYLLTFFVPLPQATIIALLSRPWVMAVEVGGGMAGLAGYIHEKGVAREAHSRPRHEVAGAPGSVRQKVQ